jgi:site-specific DNA-methyltransferase (adenine-specific)
MSDGEMAWTSFQTVTRQVELFQSCAINYTKNTFHPTEKPYKLYKWLLDKYAKQGDKILDTHLGSGSIAIACHDYGFDLTACELDKEYFDKAMKRINNHIAQTKLF